MRLRDKIILESQKLFSMKGFLTTSIQDILDATGTSKGGLYNHFHNKEELFHAVVSEARKVFRDRTLHDLDKIDKPVEQIKALLKNYSGRYLRDKENFPGGCIFTALSVELDDQRPHLSQEINEGFVRFKDMLKRLLNEGKQSGEIREDVNTDAVATLIFSSMLGASALYGSDKSVKTLDETFSTLIEFMESLQPQRNFFSSVTKPNNRNPGAEKISE